MATSDSTAFIDDVLARDKTMPIAIIGMACRFPGDATSPEKLWNMLAEKRSGWCEIPKDRFNIDAFYHPDPDRNGTVCLPTSPAVAINGQCFLMFLGEI